MKKIYISPVMRTLYIGTMQMIAVSGESSLGVITDTGDDDNDDNDASSSLVSTNYDWIWEQ